MPPRCVQDEVPISQPASVSPVSSNFPEFHECSSRSGRFFVVVVVISSWIDSFYLYTENCIYLFLTVLGLRCCSGLYLCCGAQASHCIGLSCCRASALGHAVSVLWFLGSQSTGSIVVAHGSHYSLACRISSWIQESNPCLPAFAGRFLLTQPPGKLQATYFYAVPSHGIPFLLLSLCKYQSTTESPFL